MITIFTSKDVLKDPVMIQDYLSLHGSVKYELTKEEIKWLNFISGRYAIADYLWDNCLPENDDHKVIIDLDPLKFSSALDQDCDGFGKAVMLSDDSALQVIFFYNYEEGVF